MITPPHHTDDEILKQVRFWDSRYPEALTLDLFCRETGIGHSTIQRRFGGWLALRKAAGLERRKSHLINGRVHSREQFISQLQAAAKRFGPQITQQLFCEWAGTAPNTVKAHCGNWRILRRMAGLPPRSLRRRYFSEANLLWELNRLVRTLKMWPTANQISRCGRYSYATYLARFGRMATLRRRFETFVREERTKLGLWCPLPNKDWQPNAENRWRPPRSGWFLDFPLDGC